MNYHHLHYFWVVAKEGGMARAAERLGVAIQTVSAQVRELERALGTSLLRPQGRGLALTPAGQEALRVADEIFQLGAQLPQRVLAAQEGPALRLAVGLADGLPKLWVRHFLGPVLGEAHLHLRCVEGRPDELLADLALHKLDLVLTDREPAPQRNLRFYAHAVETASLSWFGTPALAAAARTHYPARLADLPVLLPTGHAAIRLGLERWFERHGLRPRIAGEFQDSALLKTFGAAGLGVFAAVSSLAGDLQTRYGVEAIAEIDGVQEQFVALAAERKIQHPLLARLLGTGPKTARG